MQGNAITDVMALRQISGCNRKAKNSARGVFVAWLQNNRREIRLVG